MIRGILIAAIVLVCAGMGISSLMDRLPTGGDTPEGVSVLVAKDYLPAYAVVRSKTLELRPYPKALVPPGALTDLAELKTDGGRDVFFTVVPVPPGQVLTRAFLTEINKRHGMAAMLPPGKVAVSFGVEKMKGVGGWIEPGDTVAIFQSTVGLEKSQIKKSSELLFPSVEVLAVDTRRLGAIARTSSKGQMTEEENPDDSGGNVLTVVLNPLEASALIRARDSAQLSVALRAMGDDPTWN